MKDSFGKKVYTKPVLKWAGGKTQLLTEIVARLPLSYNRYFEPFLGGGALYFALAPHPAVVSDSSPELMNVYQVLSEDADRLMKKLDSLKNTKEVYYEIRSLNWRELSPLDAAARTIFLNKTCFNGLYRVNKDGQFNVPYGANKRTIFYDEKDLRAASALLQTSFVFCADYHRVLTELAQPGDFVFLDPPYVPVSEYSDFKRYTKEQFGLEDQKQLAADVKALADKGCYVMLTNSNHPIVRELYNPFKIEVFQTKRVISKDATRRNGEDVIITTY